MKVKKQKAGRHFLQGNYLEKKIKNQCVHAVAAKSL